MDEVKRKRYHELFEKMGNMMTDPENFDRDKFVGVLKEICELFRIAKGVTEFYKSLSDEKNGVGEVLVDFDNGRADKVIIKRRLVSKSNAVVKGTLYAAEEDTFTDEELEKMDIMLRSLISFVSLNRLQNTLEQIMFYDMTGYKNISYFLRHLDILNSKGKIYGKTVVQINLRHFSLINREIGREAGDVVMRNYYDKLESVIGEDGLISRIGGDIFIMVFQNELIDDVLAIIKGCPISFDADDEKRIKVSAAAGVFVIPDDYEYVRPGDLFEVTYTASQEAKMGKRGRIIYYDKNTEINRQKMIELWGSFPAAIENNEYKAYYQPKVDVVSGRIVGAEALCRWIKDGKIIPPLDFIPMLEQNMDICTLDFYMLSTVCKDIRRWINEDRKPVRISVNFSRKHLVNVDFLEQIMQIIDENNVPHEFIEIELTETINDVEFRDLKRIVSGLKAEGIRTSVDDFGMGYSSLNLIKEIPWDVIKIDKSLLPTGSGDGNVSDMMYKHIIAMAHEMGLECVTEGVETIEQVELLRENNCRMAQGFYFDRPLPVEEFEERLEKCHYEITKTI